MDWIEGDWVYDLETYPNIFTFSIIRADRKFAKTYEVSDRMNETEEILNCLRYLLQNKQRMVGFNNLGFDYLIIHEIIQDAIKAKMNNQEYSICYKKCYDKAKRIIEAMKREEFGQYINPEDFHIKQVDLYKIWHFDNKAKATSLKMLEFNMRSDNIEDLPFPVGKYLTNSEKDILKRYNAHDVMMTLDFYVKSLDAIRFRQVLSERYNRDFTNHNDTKIGKDYFVMRLESKDPEACYKKVGTRRVMKQTKRKHIDIKDCLFNYYDFKLPQFIAVMDWFKQQRITETKGVFTEIPEHNLGEVAKYAEMTVKKLKVKSKDDPVIQQLKKDFPLGWVEESELKATEYAFDEHGNHIMVPVLDEFGNVDPKKKPKKLRVNKKSYKFCYKLAECLNVVVNGFRFDFGTGGIHGSISSKIVRAYGNKIIRDWDVASMYPNIAISNKCYPLHLGEGFCDIYKDVYIQRTGFAKGTPENGVMKLALNGVYGDSNNEYSPFYDPQYTMTITINGQLSLCLLAEKLLEIDGLELIQVNTDGVTARFDKDDESLADSICELWQKQVKLQLEKAEYSAMYIRDVNNYIATYTNGKVKRKGAYEYEGLGWHQNQSSLVIPMAAEAAMLNGQNVEDFIRNHKVKYDFLLRTKVPRSSRLIMVYDDGYSKQLQNICRYYPSKTGGKLVKIMPPLEGETEERELGIDVDWKVKVCNNIEDFNWDLDYDYYISEANKLVLQEEERG